jgi:Fe-S-cluster containining protein
MDEVAETVQVEFSLAVDGGGVGVRATVPAGATNLTQIMPVLYSIDSLVVNAAAELLAKDGKTVSCKAGCGACCRQMVPVSVFEAEALAQWIGTLPPDRLQGLRERFHAVLTGLSRSGMIDRLVTEDWLDDGAAATQMAIDYFRQGLACPFLEEESCSIHPIRPMSCREYVVTSPAKYCSDPSTLQVEGVGLRLRLSRALYRMGAEIEPGSRGWIPLVFLLAWMDGGFAPGEAFEGSGPEVLYAFLQRLETKEGGA